MASCSIDDTVRDEITLMDPHSPLLSTLGSEFGGNFDRYPLHPRLCNVRAFFRWLEKYESAAKNPMCSSHHWDIGTVYNPSWGRLRRDPSQIDGKSMHALPRLQAMLVFFIRLLPQFEIPKAYKFHCDLELWHRFPQAMQEITGLTTPPLESPQKQYRWSTRRAEASLDLSAGDFDLSTFHKHDKVPSGILAFFQYYHLSFDPTYSVLTDKLMWILFPFALTQEATEAGHDENHYQPRLYSMSPAEQIEAFREQLYDEAARDTLDKNLSHHKLHNEHICHGLEINCLLPSTIKGFIFPLGTTFLAKKDKYETANRAPRPWKHQSGEIASMLRYLEMRVRTTEMPAAYDAVHDKLLWSRFPKGMRSFIGTSIDPNDTVYYDWPERGYLTQDRKSLFSIHKFDTKEALEYVASSCSYYFGHHARQFDAQQDYDPGRDLFLYKIFPSTRQRHAFINGNKLTARSTTNSTNLPKLYSDMFIYPAVTADYRYRCSPFTHDDIEDFTKCDDRPSAQPRASFSPCLRTLFNQLEFQFHRFSKPNEYFADHDRRLWEKYPEEMKIVTGLEPDVDGERRGKSWSFTPGDTNQTPNPLFQVMAIDNSNTFRFWKDYFARDKVTKLRNCYNPETDTFLWSLFPKGARQYYVKLGPPRNTKAYCGEANRQLVDCLIRADYRFKESYGTTTGGRRMLQDLKEKKQRTLYWPAEDDSDSHLEFDDRNFHPNKVPSASSDSQSDAESKKGHGTTSLFR